MGTRYNITWLSGEGQPTPEEIHVGVEAVLATIIDSMSTYEPDSDITRFNRAPLNEWFAVGEDFGSVFRMASQVSLASGGAYDVTVAPLVNLWGFGPKMGDSIPDADLIAAARAMVGMSRIEFSAERGALRKIAPVELDFSSIAKGYAVDRVAGWLEEQGIASYLVEIGGEIRVVGMSPRGTPWRIAVEKPETGARDIAAAITLTNSALATSGDYRNFFEVNGVRYSHTIDPRTGAPVTHHLVSVTVVHSSAAMADAWATALTVLGTEQALEMAVANDLAVYLISREQEGFTAVSSPAMAPLLGFH